MKVSSLNGPSEHLSWKELACKDGTPYPKNFIVDGRVDHLANIFESIRKIWDRPIKVHSAFRTLSHNRKVGGAKSSQHVQGRALDLAPPTGVTIDQFYNIIRRNANLFGIRGLGKYKTFVHVDTRPTNQLVMWSGSGVANSGINT